MDPPCPSCGAAIPLVGDEADCPACGAHVRFEEAARRPCPACGKDVFVAGASDMCRCGQVVARDPRRAVRFTARCPRCRRRLAVQAAQTAAQCPSCGAGMALRDTV